MSINRRTRDKVLNILEEHLKKKIPEDSRLVDVKKEGGLLLVTILVNGKPQFLKLSVLKD